MELVEKENTYEGFIWWWAPKEGVMHTFIAYDDSDPFYEAPVQWKAYEVHRWCDGYRLGQEHGIMAGRTMRDGELRQSVQNLRSLLDPFFAPNQEERR